MARAPTFNELFDPEFLAALERFSLRARRVPRRGRPADQTSRERGAGLEFADFKAYVPGDDLRAIDWNIYRRLGRLFVRVFEERRDLPVYLLVDRSSSMFLETPPRIRAGLQVALGLAAIALAEHDSVALFSFSDDFATDARAAAGKAGLARLAERLAAQHEQGGTALADAAEEIGKRRLRPGLLVVVSDFFDPAGAATVAEALTLCRHQLLLVQLTKAADAEPTRTAALRGDVRLLDCETGEALDIAITPAVLARYREAYQGFTEQLTTLATERGAGLLRVDVDGDVLEQLAPLFAGGALAV